MGRLPLVDGWKLQCWALAGRDAASVSTPNADCSGWHETTVPATVLTALIKQGVYPDPRVWPNAFRIPDSSDEFNQAHDLGKHSHLPDGANPWRMPWWYRVEFVLAEQGVSGPGSPPHGDRVWLNLDCLNYRADVWVNGRQVANSDQLVGMFRRFRLDITDYLRSGANALAILVHPVDHPGVPDTQLEVFGEVRGFHKDICNDVTEVMTVGYDCFPTVPDRNMGLVQEVFLEFTGPVDIRDTFVRTDLDLPELDPARLTISAELLNTSAQSVSGVLEGSITDPDGETVASFRRPTTLLSHEARTITITPTDAAELSLHSPQLWWPNTYGAQPMYRLVLTFTPDTGAPTYAEAPFGIRRLDRELYELDGAHGFRLYVNGERIFQRGGYIQPEMTFDWNPERVETELGYLRHANLNYVAFEDIPNPPDWYLDLCDRLGIMFWTCFYDCYWLQVNRPWDVDLQVLQDGTADIARRYRNHPCLVVHMAQNEGETRQDVYEMWRRTVLAHDDTRYLIPSGSFPDYRTEVPAWFARELPVGCNDYMPKTYSWQLPWVYYKLVREDRNWMFMIESGAASVPPVESLLRFMPHLSDLPPHPGDSPAYPLDEAWAHYGANRYYEWFDRGLRLLYGEPTDLADYVWKAHLVTYDQHRALFEAVHHRMWDITSGFGEWKLNSAFPDIQWQVYDWYLTPMVSLYAIRKACAKLAVQLCPLDGAVSVVNSGLQPVAGLTVQATAYDLELNTLCHRSAPVSMGANCCSEVFAIERPVSADEVPVYFVKLLLTDAAGEPVADNFYWLSPRLDDYEIVFQDDMRKFPANRPLALPRQSPCLPELAALPPVTLQVEASRPEGDGAAVGVRVSNAGGGLAFFVRLRVLRECDGEEVLPAYWTDNYFSLLPGESKALAVQLPGAPAGGFAVAVDGWNVEPGRTQVR